MTDDLLASSTAGAVAPGAAAERQGRHSCRHRATGARATVRRRPVRRSRGHQIARFGSELPPRARLFGFLRAQRGLSGLAGRTGTFCPPFPPGRCNLRGECCGRRRRYPAAAPRRPRLPALPPAMNALRRTTSSSVKLASAEPFPVIPARVQISTNFLLSIWSSLARA